MHDATAPQGREFFIRTFGGLAIESANGERGAISSQRKALALLALLAVAGERGVTRDTLMSLLWPESDLDSARNALSQLLFRLRRELGSSAVAGDGRLHLHPTLGTSDIQLFEAAIARGDHEAACTAYAGPFLDGFHLRDEGEFERWTAEQRARLERAYFHALETLAGFAAGSGDYASSARTWRRRIDADRLNSRAARGYVEALVASGDREAAIAFSVTYSALVRAELGVEVDPETARLFERARAESSPTRTVVRPSAAEEAREADAQSSLTPRIPHGVTQPVTNHRWRMPGLAALATLVVAAGSMAFLRMRGDSAPNTVLIAPFRSATSDSAVVALGRIAASYVADGLAHTGLVPIVDPQSALLPADVGVSQLARSSGAGLVVTASLSMQGDSVEFLARILRAPHDRIVSSLVPIRVSTKDPGAGLAALSSRIAGAIAALVDPRMATLVTNDPPAPQFAAYQEFVEGLDFFMGRTKRTTDYTSAVTHFKRAVQLDSTFNLPYVWMVLAYGNLGVSFDFGHFGGWDVARQDSVVEILVSRRATLSRADRSVLDFFLAERRRDHETAYRAVAIADSLTPGSVWTYLHGVWAKSLGYNAAALKAFGELDADGGWITNWSVYWRDFAEVLHAAGRYSEELAVARRGASRSGDPYVLRAVSVALGTAGDTVALDRFADSIGANLRDLPMVVPGAWLSLAAQEARSHGHEAASIHIAGRCVRWHREHVPDSAITGAYNLYLAKIIDCLYLASSWREAQALAEQAIDRDLPVATGAMATLALIAAREGDQGALRQRLAQAYARPAFAVDSQWRYRLDARLAAVRSDTNALVANLRFLPRPACHDCPEITSAMRRVPAVQDLR